MGNTKKEGLDFFPLDVDIYTDDKILLAQELIDPDATSIFLRFSVPYIAVRLLMEIYKNGYQMEWSDVICRQHVRNIGNGMTMVFMDKILSALVESKFFSGDKLKEHNILTSHGIQKRWLHIMKLRRRKPDPIDERFILTKISSRSGQKSAGNSKKSKCTLMPDKCTLDHSKCTLIAITSEDFAVPFFLSNNTSNSIDNKGNKEYRIIKLNKKEEKREKCTSKAKYSEEIAKNVHFEGENVQKSASDVSELYKNVQELHENVQELVLEKIDLQILNEMKVGEEFILWWGKWVNYRWLEHKRVYKSIPSKRQALENLVTISGRDENIAIQIIKKSISNTWVQFFPLDAAPARRSSKIDPAKTQNSKPRRPEPAKDAPKEEWEAYWYGDSK